MADPNCFFAAALVALVISLFAKEGLQWGLLMGAILVGVTGWALLLIEVSDSISEIIIYLK